MFVGRAWTCVIGMILLGITAADGRQPRQHTRPDFSGTWKLDPDASSLTGPPGAPQGGQGAPAGGGSTSRPAAGSPIYEPMIVTQTAQTLTIESPYFQTVWKQAHNLDGTKSQWLAPAGSRGWVDAESVAKWQGTSLVVEMTWEGRTRTIRNTETWSLERGRLVVQQVTDSGRIRRVYNRVQK